MAKDVLAKAMDPFFTTKGVGKGTGLGLSIVYTTVQAHQGQLTLHSDPGQGTQASLLLPVAAGLELLPEGGAAGGPASAPAGWSLLLVDDDELVRRSTAMLIELLEQGHRPDAVLLDLNMPGLGGRGSLPRLRAICPGLPVLLATGRADQEALDLVTAYPQVTLLTKPFSLEDLRNRLATLGS
jgi:hypothetical protein